MANNLLIITPVYNRAEEMKSLLKSMEASLIKYEQNKFDYFSNISWLICDDGSDVDVEVEFQKKEIDKICTIVRYKSFINKGKMLCVRDALNTFKTSNKCWLTVVDSDDLIHVNFFSILADAFNHDANVEFFSFASDISRNLNSKNELGSYLDYRFNKGNLQDRCDFFPLDKYKSCLNSLEIENGVCFPEFLLYYKLYMNRIIHFHNQVILIKHYTKEGYSKKMLDWKIKSAKYFLSYYRTLYQDPELNYHLRLSYFIKLYIFKFLVWIKRH
jgi:hypothetical protein